MVDGDFFDKMEAIARYKFAGICRELEWSVEIQLN